MSNKQASSVSLWLCIAFLALGPACGGGAAGDSVSAGGTNAALTNKLDDDKDGRIDEGDEGLDEDDDGEVDEADEHKDACAARAEKRASAQPEQDDAGDSDDADELRSAEPDDEDETEHEDDLDCSDVEDDDEMADGAEEGEDSDSI
mgnify:FL=1